MKCWSLSLGDIYQQQTKRQLHIQVNIYYFEQWYLNWLENCGILITHRTIFLEKWLESYIFKVKRAKWLLANIYFYFEKGMSYKIDARNLKEKQKMMEIYYIWAVSLQFNLKHLFSFHRCWLTCRVFPALSVINFLNLSKF